MSGIVGLCVNDLGKILCLKACTADESAVDLGHCLEPCGILCVHASAVENTGILSKYDTVQLRNHLADSTNGAVGFLVGCGLARTDGPNGLVRNNDVLCLFGANALVESFNLRRQEGIGNAGFALFQSFADSYDRDNAVFKCSHGTHVDALIGLTEVLTAFTMADNGILNSDILEHIGTYLARIGALCCPMYVL